MKTINNIFMGIIGINMVIGGVIAIIEIIVILAKKKRAITHILSILYLVGGPLLIFFGVYLSRKFLLQYRQAFNLPLLYAREVRF